MVDTNSSPKDIDFVIPANDDATKSISVILDALCGAIKEGLEERKSVKDKDDSPNDKKGTKPRTERRPVAKVVARRSVSEDVEDEKVEKQETKEPIAKKTTAKKVAVKKPIKKSE
ncbi:MAG: hypothetical protein A2236_00990 [Bacteroidetes bacterium RIFOXYA2_FULL_33_7]|nr:MAG: hypothetical protein A2236_00990 [Bacteroidetes bacterium RIFOXYA2_FULL_33_7]